MRAIPQLVSAPLKYKTTINQRLGSAGEDDAFIGLTKLYTYLSCNQWNIEIDGSWSLL